GSGAGSPCVARFAVLFGSFAAGLSRAFALAAGSGTADSPTTTGYTTTDTTTTDTSTLATTTEEATTTTESTTVESTSTAATTTAGSAWKPPSPPKPPATRIPPPKPSHSTFASTATAHPVRRRVPGRDRNV